MGNSEKKYYWLKLKRDFFKRHDICIIENMKDGKEIILFYLKLVCESVDHEGRLRFSDEIPYNTDMLAAITNTSKEITVEAIEILCMLKMLEVDDEGTYTIKGVEKIIGSETAWAEKKRTYREQQAAAKGQPEEPTRTTEGQTEDRPRTKKDSVRQEIEKEIEIEKELDIETEKEIEYIDANASPAPKKEVKHRSGYYQHVLLTNAEREKLVDEYGLKLTDEAIKHLDEYIEMKGYKAKSHYLCIKKWVIDAVKEQQAKRNTNSNPADSLNNYYDMMSDWATQEGNA